MTVLATSDQLAAARAARGDYRAGRAVPTSGVAAGLTQANLIAVPADWAFETLLYAQRNPKPCPVLEVIEQGQVESVMAPGSDIRTDVGRYRIWRDGELTSEVNDATEAWDEHPDLVGIADLSRPDFGDAPEVREGEIPVFWACGVTPQAAIMASKPPFAVTHAPGYMFITDVPDAEYIV